MEMFFKPVHSIRWRLVAPLCVAWALAACSVPVDQRGNLPDEANLSQIKPGETDKATVTRLLGTPSTVAAFDANTWYYVSQKTKTVAFFRTDVLDQQVVAITFNQDGVVKTVDTHGLQDAQAVTPNPNATPSKGREFSTIEMFLGNFGKFVNKSRPNDSSDTEGGGGP
ncbi:MAG TPA: outer membrane protein assembly factor BamE [Stellaceae bacterium]|jgi:outer membrane protein assembly factor BamE (lipoprotein component of BamABCDE complex)|nr:outer membrane protein assembly factor BamE [Stellaceae bacterium]